MKSAWQLTMRILGCMRGNLLLLMTLGITMGSSIASPTPTIASPTSAESTSYRSESPREEKEKLPQSQTGNDITEALTNLNETLKLLAETLSKEKSSPSTQPLEK